LKDPWMSSGDYADQERIAALIFTSCPYCQRPDIFALTRTGKWLATRCRGCSKVMWVEMVRESGTTISSETLLSMAPEGDRLKIEELISKAVCCSQTEGG